jgi:hypothetical protein
VRERPVGSPDGLGRGRGLVRDVETNYEVCRRYLRRNHVLGEQNPDVLTSVYTGGPRPDYSSMLNTARGAIGSSP